MTALCSVIDCERPVKTKASGLCSPHYQRQRKGLPLEGRPIIERSYKCPEDRFWLKVNKDAGDCWLWTALKNGSGYGIITINKKVRLAHRFAYELLVGPIPDGLQLDHLCRVRHCVNPAHLEPVTCRENLHRGDTWAARNAAKTHCPQGHPYDEKNTLVSGGLRSCRTCARDRARSRSRRRAS